MRVRIALVAVVASLVAWLYASGPHESLDPQTMRIWLRRSGAWGGALFLLAHAGLQPLGVRSVFFLLVAPLVWDPLTAFFLSWAGTVAASLVAFGFARFVARDWVQRRLPAGVRRLDDRLSTSGFRTVLLLRLLFFTTPALQYGLGVSRVAAGPFLLGTLLGVVPFTALMTAFGSQINDWLASHPLSTWPWEHFGPLLVILVVAVVVGGSLLVRLWQDKLSLEPTRFSHLSTEQDS